MAKTTKRRAAAAKTTHKAPVAEAAAPPLPRALVPAVEVMEKLQKRRQAYWDMLDEVVKAALGLGEAGCDGAEYQEAVIDDLSKEPAKRNVRAHAFDMMAARAQVSPAEWAAGTRFRDDFEMAFIAPLRAASFSDLYDTRGGPGHARPVPPKGLTHEGLKDWLDDQVRRSAQTWRPKAPQLAVGWRDLRPAVIDAQDRLKAVRRAVGIEEFRLLEAVCGEGRTINSLEALGKHGTRKTIARKLHAALDALGRHYGMWTALEPRRQPRPVRGREREAV